jgi:hypothetical protein
MKAVRQIILSMAALAIVGPCLAADISLSMDSRTNSITLTNLLQQPVHVMGLGSNAAYLGVSMDLPAGGSGSIKYTGTLPVLSFARCLGTPEGGALINRTPSKEGFYDLSLSVQ